MMRSRYCLVDTRLGHWQVKNQRVEGAGVALVKGADVKN